MAVGPHFVVKHGRAVSENEGQTLLFLEEHCGDYLRVPKLYAMYHLLSTGHLCLVMERLPGETLEHLWPELDVEEKWTICVELKRAMDRLREIPPPGFYGGVGRTPIPHHLFWDPEQKKEICGPFESESLFNAGMVGKLRENDALNSGFMTAKVEFYERNLDAMLNGHPPVFTHSDFQRKNILVYRTVDKTFEIAIIDWETAGWYPTYWEYALKFATMQWEGDWPKLLEQIVDVLPGEAAIFRMLYQELWF